MGALWALASPLFGVADEPAHVVRAAAVARGQLGGHDRTDFADRQVRTEVRLPLVYATATTLPSCYIGRTGVPAGCAPGFSGSEEAGPVLTQVGRYPPAYYLAVGLPGRWFAPSAGVRVMRLVSAAIVAGLLASAFASLRDVDDGPSLLLGLVVAVTPMALFLAGSVNPSGVEIAAAVGLWTALTGLLLGHREGTTARFAARAAVAGSCLLVARQMGPLVAGLVLVVMAVVAGRERSRAVARVPEVRRAAVVLGAVALASIAWIVARGTLVDIGGTPPPGPLSMRGVLQQSLGRTPTNVLQMIGRFGWTDTPAPSLTYYVWFACLGLLGFAGLARARRREVVGLVLLIGLVVAVPVALESSRARDIGFVWLGRYTLPLAVGVPILAARLAGDLLGSLGRRLVPLVVGATALGHAHAFVSTLERYSGGYGVGTSDPWTPPGTTPGLILGFLVVAGAYAWWLCRGAGLSSSPPARRPWPPAPT